MNIPPTPYRFQSVDTKFFAISTPEDKPGQEVIAKPGHPFPEDSILYSNRPIGDQPVVVKIISVPPKRLYVTLEGDPEKTQLTWSERDDDRKNLWVVRKTPKDTYVISPGNGQDLYWVSDSKTGENIEALPGKDIRPPQNEWFIIPA